MIVASGQGEVSRLQESPSRSCLSATVQRGAVPTEPEEEGRAPEEAQVAMHLVPRGHPQVGPEVGCLWTAGPKVGCSRAGSQVGCSRAGPKVGWSRAGVQCQAPALTPGAQIIQAEDLG